MEKYIPHLYSEEDEFENFSIQPWKITASSGNISDITNTYQRKNLDCNIQSRKTQCMNKERIQKKKLLSLHGKKQRSSSIEGQAQPIRTFEFFLKCKKRKLEENLKTINGGEKKKHMFPKLKSFHNLHELNIERKVFLLKRKLNLKENL